MRPDIAICHDQINTHGGAERVTFELAQALDAPVYAMSVDESIVPADVTAVELSSRLGEWAMDRHYQIQDLYQMLAWQHQDELYEFDIILQSKTNPYWFVPCSDYQTVIRYCHSTPRNLYDQHDRRGGGLVTDAVKLAQRMLYQQTYAYADHWIANSEIVQRRIETYVDPATAGVETVHPPVDTQMGDPGLAPTADYLFTVGRLARNKRIGLIRDVAAAVDCPVVVAGDGPRRDELPTVGPAVVTDRALWAWRRRDRFDIDRLVVHYMQPHVPFRARPGWTDGWDLSDFGTAGNGKNDWHKLRDGDLDADEFWAAYRDNLQWVLDEVERWRRVVDGDILVTADHGNAAGEYQQWGHPPGSANPALRRVPWVHLSGTGEVDRDPAPAGEPPVVGEQGSFTADVNRRLDALGYK